MGGNADITFIIFTACTLFIFYCLLSVVQDMLTPQLDVKKKIYLVLIPLLFMGAIYAEIYVMTYLYIPAKPIQIIHQRTLPGGTPFKP